MVAHNIVTTLILFLFPVLYCSSNEIGKKEDSFREELFLKSYPSGDVYSYFQFTTLWNTSSHLNPCRFFYFNQPSKCFYLVPA